MQQDYNHKPYEIHQATNDCNDGLDNPTCGFAKNAAGEILLDSQVRQRLCVLARLKILGGFARLNRNGK